MLQNFLSAAVMIGALRVKLIWVGNSILLKCADIDLYFQPNEYKQRRMSDPSQAFNSFMNGARKKMQKSRSEAENVDTVGTDFQEVEAGTLYDGQFKRTKYFPISG